MIRKSIALAAVIFAAIAVFAEGSAACGSIELRLEPGAHYAHSKWFGPLPVTLRPQIAFWIETADGAYVDTIYVTERSAKGNWRSAGGARRPEALPIWSHARGKRAADGLLMPDATTPVTDAVTGATPSAAFTRTWQLPAGFKPGKYRVRAELNQSYDWNSEYPDKLSASDPRYSEANGQPSIEWSATIDIGVDPASTSLEPEGTGSIDGSDGALRLDHKVITTAKAIAKSIWVFYKP